MNCCLSRGLMDRYKFFCKNGQVIFHVININQQIYIFYDLNPDRI